MFSLSILFKAHVGLCLAGNKDPSVWVSIAMTLIKTPMWNRKKIEILPNVLKLGDLVGAGNDEGFG